MRYLIFNETDGVYAHPEPVSARKARRIVRAIRRRYGAQGYYSSVAGRIPVSELRFRLIPDSTNH
jgi:hypothetical protein